MKNYVLMYLFQTIHLIFQYATRIPYIKHKFNQISNHDCIQKRIKDLTLHLKKKKRLYYVYGAHGVNRFITQKLL